MDTRTAAVDVSQSLQEIKDFMPETYKCIKAKAAEFGNEAYALVRKGLRGDANCFFAMEKGRVKGTPFTRMEGADLLADLIAQMGCAYVCIIREPAKKGSNGTH